jgi:peptide/nickel transport system substrate-binding protein
MLPFDQPADEHATNLIGTGAFVVEEIVPGERAILRRNENYWRMGADEQPLPYLDEVQLLVMPDRAAQIAGLQAGTLDLAQEIGFDYYPLVASDPNLVAAPSAPIVRQVIYMDVTRPPFDDQRVRDAMRYLVDRQGLLDAAYYGEGKVACDTAVAIRLPQIGTCDRDVDKAKELLAEAGFADGLRIDLWTLSDRPGFLEVAVAFAEQAKDAGVTFEIKTQPANIFWSEMWLKAQIGVANWSPRPNPDAELRVHHGCNGPWNESHFCSLDMELLLDEALVESDESRRAALYREVQELLLAEDGHIVPFFYPRLAARRANVMDFVTDATNQHDLSVVWLKPEV